MLTLSTILTPKIACAESAKMTPARYAEFATALLRFHGGIFSLVIKVKEDDLGSSQKKRRADIGLNTIRSMNTLLNMYNNYQEIIIKNSTQIEPIDVQYSAYNIGELGLNIINIIKDIKHYNKKKNIEGIDFKK